MKCYGVMCDAVSCDVLRDSYVTDGALTPAAQCLTQISAACGRREGGCSAVPTRFHGSLQVCTIFGEGVFQTLSAVSLYLMVVGTKYC